MSIKEFILSIFFTNLIKNKPLVLKSNQKKLGNDRNELFGYCHFNIRLLYSYAFLLNHSGTGFRARLISSHAI